MMLLGHSDEPGHLEGHGPIDPDTAREIAARAPSFRRILTHPETGVVLSIGRDRYQVPKDLRRYLRVRDETCRWPGCRRAAAHSNLNHTLDWQFDGHTAHNNLAPLTRPPRPQNRNPLDTRAPTRQNNPINLPDRTHIHQRASHDHPCAPARAAKHREAE